MKESSLLKLGPADYFHRDREDTLARVRFRPKELYLAAEVVAAAAGGAALARYANRGWFFLDDFTNLSAAREIPLSQLIWKPSGLGHLAPGSWVLNWVVAGPFSVSRAASSGMLAVFLALGLFCLCRALDELFGKHPINPVLTILCGTSWVLVSPTGWLATSFHTIPGFALWCVALYCFARWRRSDGVGWAIASTLATTAAITFSTQTALVPLLLAVCVLLIPRRPGAPDRRQGGRRRDLLVCSVQGLLCIAFVGFERLRPWAKPVHVPSFSDVLTFMRVSLFDVFLPTVVGLGSGAAESHFDSRLRIIVLAVLVAGLAASYLTKRCALRAIALFGCIFVAVVVVVMPSRGVLAAQEYRYLAPLPLAFWMSVRLATVRQPTKAKEQRPRRRASRSAVPLWRVAGTVLVALALIVYGINFARTERTNDFFIESGRTSREIVARIQRGTDEAAARGLRRSFVDLPLPFPIAYADCGPEVSGPCTPITAENLLSWHGHVIDSRIVPLGEGAQLLAISADGTIERAAFSPTPARTQDGEVADPVRLACKESCKTTISFTTGSDLAFVRFASDSRSDTRVTIHTRARVREKDWPVLGYDVTGRVRTVPIWTKGGAQITISARSHPGVELGIEVGTLRGLRPIVTPPPTAADS
jgi:hypothetical protein